MTTIDQVRELSFYLLRKLNDFMVALTTEAPPPLRPPVYQPTNEAINAEIERLRHGFGINSEDDDIDRQINEIQAWLDEDQPTLRSPPTTEEVERRVNQQKEEFYNSIEERAKEIQTKLNDMKALLDEEELKDLEKQVKEKETLLDYLIHKLINLRNSKADITIINHVSDEFHSLKEEKDKLEERINILRN